MDSPAARSINADHGKDLAFVIATNLALLGEEILGFCADEDVYLSTSLDGPEICITGTGGGRARTAGSRRSMVSGRCRSVWAPTG